MRHIIYIAVLLMIVGCSSPLKKESELYHWINQTENGLIKNRIVSGYSLTAKYLPTELLTYKELKSLGSGADKVDSIYQVNKNSVTFLLTIGPDENTNQDFDIMKAGITSYEEYNKRVQKMNFELGEYLSLRTANGEYYPVLFDVENIYGLSKSRTISIVFTPLEKNSELLQAEKYDLVFNDQIFNTGVNHFVFHKKEMKFPEVNYAKMLASL